MTTRQIILVACLGAALLGFLAFMVANFNSDPLPLVLFGALYVAVAATLSRRSQRKRLMNPAASPGVLATFTASYALGFAMLLALGVISLPFVGYAGFDLIGTKWFPAMVIVATAAGYPIARKWLR